WRRTVDRLGGPLVLGAIVLAVLAAAVLIFLNRPGGAGVDGGEAFVPRDHDALEAGRLLGDPGAPVTLIEYSDYQCPFCRRFWAETEPVLIEQYVETGRASIEFRDYAFLGPESYQAAEAAACAADQDQYWNFHDLLFLRQGAENSGVFSDENLARYAGELQAAVPAFDVDAWQTCFDAGTYEDDVVASAQQAAREHGIASTPTLIVDGERIEGARDTSVFVDAIEAALAGAAQ
ncbi:MAG: thioredoxin domain-containing protein, partial [Dehalococcoidia bacterium]